MGHEPTIDRFLRERPEWKSETRIDPEHGLLMSSNCVKAFGNWAVEVGLAEPKRAAEFRQFIEGIEICPPQ